MGPPLFQFIVFQDTAGRPVSGPYEKEGTASGFAVGAGALTRPPSVSNVPVQNRRGGTLGRPVSIDRREAQGPPLPI